MAWLGSISCFSRAGASPLRLFPSYANTRRRLLRMSSNCGNVCKNRIVTTSKNFKDLLKKVNTFNDADFTARKLLSNSWDAYVVNNSSFKIIDKSLVDIIPQRPFSVCGRGSQCFFGRDIRNIRFSHVRSFIL